MKVSYASVEEFGRTAEEALTKAVKKLAKEYGSDNGCQATLWYGIDKKTEMPVCRITYIKLEPET